MAIIGQQPAASPPPRPAAPRRAPAPAARPISFTDDRDAMIRTVIGEAGNQGPDGQTAVAAVIANRARQNGRPAREVVLERNQFEPWGNAATAQRLMSVPADDPRYIQAAAAVDRAMAGDDPTGGADHFFAPRAQAALGREVPSWAQGRDPTVIGDHNFYNLGGSTEQHRQAAPQADLAGMSDEAILAAARGEPAPAAPARSSPGFELPEGVVDWDLLSDQERQGLQRGARVLMPQNEGETFRQIVTLAGDAGGPQRNPLPGDDVQMFGGVRGIVPGAADMIGGVASGAAEQVPGLDEAVTGLDALINRRSFSESRDQYRDTVTALNEQQRGARNVGGVLGFGGTMLLPGLGGANYIRGARAAGPLTQGGRFAERAGQIGRAMQVGGAAGAVYGGTAADGGVEDRARGFGTGALWGAGGGGVTQGVAPVVAAGVRRLVSGLSEAGAVIGRGFGRVAPDAEITPDATAAAREYVARIARSSGADLANNPAEAMGLPITAAEALGSSGVANVTALTRRSGRAGNAVRNQIGAREVERPSQVVQDFADMTGIDPAGSADMIQNLADTGRKRAAPLYKEMRALQVQPSPLIEQILTRPVGQAALRRAYRIARDEGRDPSDLGLFVSTRNEPRPTGAGRPARDPELFADLDAMRSGRRTQGAGRGESLLSFISKNGGIRDDGGELAQIGADTWNRQGAWRSRAVRDDGLSLEQMADRARAAGYFPDVVDATADSADNYQRLSSQDIINAIDDELRGNPMFAREVGDTNRSAAAAARTARRDALEERLNREGIDLSKASNEDVARALNDADDAEARAMAFLDGESPGEPQIELLPGEVPSMQTLDYVKRGMDDVVNGFRNQITRSLDLDEGGRAIVGAVRSYRDELVRLTGGDEGVYARALAAGGEPLRLEDAFRRSEKLFQTGTPMRTFQTAIERMGEAERNALVAGFADKMFRDSQSGGLSLNRMQQLTVPVTREKLAVLLGPERADDFIRRIGARIELARSGSRMAPGTNSTTPEALAAMAEQDGQTGFSADMARSLVTSKGDVGSALMLTAGKAAVAPLTGFFRGLGNPQNTATRDEMARLFMLLPSEAQAELTAVASRPAPGLLAKASQAFVAPGGGLLGSASAQGGPPRARRENRQARR